MIRNPTNRPPTHPGEMIRAEFLEPLHLTQRELAERLGISYPRMNELIHARRGVSTDTALRLEQLFGIEAQFWLNLQLAWDLFHARRSPKATKIRRIEQLPTLRQGARSKEGRLLERQPPARQSRAHR